MPCDPEELRHVPLFQLLDDDEAQVLAAQIEVRRFAARQRIFKSGDPFQHAYVVLEGSVRVFTLDEDGQQVVVDEPVHGDVFGIASLMQKTAHQTTAEAITDAVCLEIGRDDIEKLVTDRPDAALDMLTVQARQFHASQNLVRSRSTRNPNELIEEQETFGERLADSVARFGGSWLFIVIFAVTLSAYTAINLVLKGRAWDPYPFILLNLFLSMLAAIQAPVIMMSQNRQDVRDRLRSELDFEVNRRAETEIQALSRRLSLLTEKVEDITDLMRVAETDAQEPRK